MAPRRSGAIENEARMDLLRAEHITKRYGDRTILKDVSVRLEEGELVSLLGLSGSGKTTLFHVLSGLIPPEEGRVLLKGEDVTAKPGKVSYMLQKDLLLAHKKVIDNVALPLLLAGRKKKEARKEAAPYFEDFGLAGTEMLYPAQLSGGMRQRAAFLRTYLSAVAASGEHRLKGAQKPSGAALLDEPFSALDTITKSQMHDWYLDVMEKISLSTLFITDLHPDREPRRNPRRNPDPAGAAGEEGLQYDRGVPRVQKTDPGHSRKTANTMMEGNV